RLAPERLDRIPIKRRQRFAIARIARRLRKFDEDRGRHEEGIAPPPVLPPRLRRGEKGVHPGADRGNALRPALAEIKIEKRLAAAEIIGMARARSRLPVHALA